MLATFAAICAGRWRLKQPKSKPQITPTATRVATDTQAWDGAPSRTQRGKIQSSSLNDDESPPGPPQEARPQGTSTRLALLPSCAWTLLFLVTTATYNGVAPQASNSPKTAFIAARSAVSVTGSHRAGRILGRRVFPYLLLITPKRRQLRFSHEQPGSRAAHQPMA